MDGVSSEREPAPKLRDTRVTGAEGASRLQRPAALESLGGPSPKANPVVFPGTRLPGAGTWMLLPDPAGLHLHQLRSLLHIINHQCHQCHPPRPSDPGGLWRYH